MEKFCTCFAIFFVFVSAIGLIAFVWNCAQIGGFNYMVQAAAIAMAGFKCTHVILKLLMAR